MGGACSKLAATFLAIRAAARPGRRDWRKRRSNRPRTTLGGRNNGHGPQPLLLVNLLHLTNENRGKLSFFFMDWGRGSLRGEQAETLAGWSGRGRIPRSLMLPS